MRNSNSFCCFVIGVVCLALSFGSPVLFAATHAKRSCAITDTARVSPPNIDCISGSGCPPHRYYYFDMGACSEPSESDCSDHLKYEWQRYSVKRYMYNYDNIPLSIEAREALAGAAACFAAGSWFTTVIGGLVAAIACGAAVYAFTEYQDICIFYGCKMDWTAGSFSGPQSYSCL